MSDFTTNQQLDQRALAKIELAAHALSIACNEGRSVGSHPKYRALLEGVQELFRDCPLIQDAISDTFHDWDEEAAEPDFWLEDEPCPRQLVTLDYTR